MTVAYIISNSGDFIALDSTRNFNKTRSATITSSSVMNGRSVGDNMTIGNPSFSMSGIVTYNHRSVKTNKIPPDPLQFNKYLDALMEGKELFTLYRDDFLGSSEKNVALVEYSIDQETYIDSVAVTLSFQKPYITLPAVRTRIPRIDVAGQTSDQVNGKNGKKTAKTSEEDYTIGGLAAQRGIDLFAKAIDSIAGGD